ncbi:hypothetical protein KAFR_0B00970 [Kazachstania africana CBS 2517]|uniref:Sas10 C-terminal domain-containing protein n=1 Tax=Kazachstania africana (strain ATCC 22294 / BCRC 22015 / CBS 2517 / CECT 1963 / NBRC 1671 / NRRL Y-8276) TaxID=1071382 RepID=H2APU5_KAZAF|nr:hypothetical protein KAFR_0B00970 [Kazachstania africana CBS 2517]CCF56395.1 hypothetical protein KAFR_0B00970 [Kazachstania africana CBS 2517]
MARKQDREEDRDPYGLNEVDAFADKKEKILLEQSTLNTGNGNESYDSLDDDEEEEVMGMSGEDSSDDEEEEEEELDGEKAYRKVFGKKLHLGESEDEADENMLDNENAWGATKNEYYGADDLDDEEVAKEIEKEALRQQKKHLQELNMNDYMDEEVEEEWTKSAKEFDMNEFQTSTNTKSDNTVSIKDLLNMDSDAKKDYLKNLIPEFLPLCKELATLSEVLEELKAKEQSELVKLKVMALSAYLGTISSYLGILLHEINSNEDFSSMKDHPIMESILTSKEVWRQANELPGSFEAGQQLQDDSEDEDEEMAELDESILQNIPISEETKDEHTAAADSGANNDSEDEGDDDGEDDDVDLDDFEEYVTQSRLPTKSKEKAGPTDADDFLESEMADVDAQEKRARKRTLRFYTSKIDQQENKKIDKFKGDDDIPYKERLFERQQRLLEEARKRGLHDKNGADLDDKNYNSEDEAVSKSINDKSIDDYYTQIQKSRQNRKESRQQAHKTAVMAAREGKLAEASEAVGEDGKRAINYQILKNKGLTPKRKKDNRNSRVKKRKKYEKAQKKLKSVRAVYSGGQSGPYEGEKTGIKKNLTKSAKFKN